jgi:hypothetical protein
MLSDQFKSIFLDRQPAAHGSKLLLGEVNFSSTTFSPNLDKQPIIRAPVRGSGLISMKRGLVRAAISRESFTRACGLLAINGAGLPVLCLARSSRVVVPAALGSHDVIL